MNTILKLQKELLNSFKDSTIFKEHIVERGPSPENRLSVYHNNVMETLTKCLSVNYPLTWKLVGEECARAAAYTFVKQGNAFPNAGTLHDWGADFPTFLESYEHTQSLPYFPDFAKLEWLMHLAYNAKDTLPLKSEDFASLSPEQYEQLTFIFHPSAFLFSSKYPLDQVMAVLEDKVEGTTLENRGSFALINRPGLNVNVHWISEDHYKLFSYLKEGIPLLEALEKLNIENFAFYDFLSFSLKNGVFSTYKL